MPGLPQSLRSQFMLGIAALSVLIVAIGMAGVFALRNGSEAAQRLAQEQLEHAQQSQRLALHASAVERELARWLATAGPGQAERSHEALIDQVRLLEGLLSMQPVADEGLPHTAVLDSARAI